MITPYIAVIIGAVLGIWIFSVIGLNKLFLKKTRLTKSIKSQARTKEKMLIKKLAMAKKRSLKK